jgi:hypothetical protein
MDEFIANSQVVRAAITGAGFKLQSGSMVSWIHPDYVGLTLRAEFDTNYSDGRLVIARSVAPDQSTLKQFSEKMKLMIDKIILAVAGGEYSRIAEQAAYYGFTPDAEFNTDKYLINCCKRRFKHAEFNYNFEFFVLAYDEKRNMLRSGGESYDTIEKLLQKRYPALGPLIAARERIQALEAENAKLQARIEELYYRPRRSRRRSTFRRIKQKMIAGPLFGDFANRIIEGFRDFVGGISNHYSNSRISSDTSRDPSMSEFSG